LTGFIGDIVHSPTRGENRFFQANQPYPPMNRAEGFPSGRHSMTRTFTQRVRTAATAGWWAILIAVLWVSFAWLGNLAIQHFRPEWIRVLWGREVTWAQINWIMLMFVAVIKVILFTVVIVTIWLTIWGRQLGKLGDS
jgi:hypothetical protein